MTDVFSNFFCHTNLKVVTIAEEKSLFNLLAFIKVVIKNFDLLKGVSYTVELTIVQITGLTFDSSTKFFEIAPVIDA